MDATQLPMLVDIGFVFLVSAAAISCLFQKSGRSDASSKEWREELLQLETMLRELVSEASAASTFLDRNLLKRKGELENLLARIETHVADERFVTLTNSVDVSSAISADTEEELPNESWSRPLDRSNPTTTAASTPQKGAKQRAAAPTAKAAPAKQAARPQVDDIENLLDESRDSLSISRTAKGLAKAVEVEKVSEPSVPSSLTGNYIDPVAYKVARRLLEQGKEIHVVARKVGISVADVRAIDGQIREERDGIIEAEPLPRRNPEATTRRERAVREEDVELDLEIQRELSLL